MTQSKEDLGFYQSEIQTGVSFTAFMTAVASFFMGLLITRIDSIDITIKVPILFLIISTVGFLYSTIVYSNASGEITRLDSNKAKDYMLIGNVLSEYFGVYLLVLSVPLVINAITADMFLRIATLFVIVMSLSLYSISQFSIAHRYLKTPRKNLFTFIIVLFEIVIFFAQSTMSPYFTGISIIFLLFIISCAYYFYRLKEWPVMSN